MTTCVNPYISIILSGDTLVTNGTYNMNWHKIADEHGMLVDMALGLVLTMTSAAIPSWMKMMAGPSLRNLSHTDEW